jgi:hypothetical protein
MTVSLNQLKQQLNIEVDNATDDDLLSKLIGAATAHVGQELGFAVDDADEFPAGTPDDVAQAVLLIAAHWYENREATVIGAAGGAVSLPIGVRDILANRRGYTFGLADDA